MVWTESGAPTHTTASCDRGSCGKRGLALARPIVGATQCARLVYTVRSLVRALLAWWKAYAVCNIALLVHGITRGCAVFGVPAPFACPNRRTIRWRTITWRTIEVLGTPIRVPSVDAQSILPRHAYGMPPLTRRCTLRTNTYAIRGYCIRASNA